jgi:hypothetical protein
MAKEIDQEQHTKFEIRREDNACTQIFKWDKRINPHGPISVETQWKQWILDTWENEDKTNTEDE